MNVDQGRQFEIEVAALLHDLGWNTALTPVASDGGCDIIAGCGHEVLVVECKDWAQPVGVDAVRAVHAARTRHRAAQAIVVARGAFQRSARNEAAALSVRLAHVSEFGRNGDFDRTEAARHVRKAEAAAREAARRAELVELWRRYDTALQAHARRAPVRLAAWIGLIIATAASVWTVVYLWRDHIGWSIFASFLLWAVLPNVAGYLWSLKPPAPPEQPRP